MWCELLKRKKGKDLKPMFSDKQEGDDEK